jgi:CBS domain-containing protein
MLVSQILGQKSQSGVITAPPNMKIAELSALLGARKIGAVIVSSDGSALDGIVSERDVVRALGLYGAGCLADPISSIMTARVVTCTPGARADEVLQQMTDGRFRHLPVLDKGALVGLISIGDVVKARLAELAFENNALEGMIKGY